MASSVYSRGESLFSAKLSEIDPDCDFIKYKPQTGLDHFNLAFALLYHGRNNIRKCKNVKLAQRMTAALDADMTDEYNDMEDACDYVLERRTAKIVWEDDWATTSGSLAGFDIDIPGGGRWKVPFAQREWPEPIWNFRKAIEARANDQVEVAGAKFAPNASKIVDGFDKSAFDGMVALLAKWRSDMDKIDKMAWILDPDEEQVFQFKQAKKRLSYTKSLSRLESVLDQTSKYRDADFNDTSSVAFALLTEAVDFIPVFGTFYGKMLKPLPGFFATFKALFSARLQKQLNP